MSQAPLMLYTAATPNGYKVSIGLEELKAVGAIPGYDFQAIAFQQNEQKADWFLKINPNGRIPALTDRARNDFNVWETASILLYLGRHYDKNKIFGFVDEDEDSEMLTWMFFMHGGLGPMQGQSNHFTRYAPETIPYAQKRYQEETKRLYHVFDTRLCDRDFLVGTSRGKYSWADMSVFPWVRGHSWAGIETLDEFPHLGRWLEVIAARPAVIEGLKIPATSRIAEVKENPELAQKAAEEARKWILWPGTTDSDKK